MAAVQVGDVSLGDSHATGVLQSSCITFNPACRSQTSKTDTQDDTVAIGENQERRLVADLLPPLVHRRAPQQRLFDISGATHK